MTEISKQRSTKIVSFLVFLSLLAGVLLTLISVVFPALLLRLSSRYPSTINPFEVSPWNFPLLAANVFLFGVGFLYYKKNLPTPIQKSIRFIQSFEVSHKIALIVVVSLLIIYIGLSAGELEHSKEEFWDDYVPTKDGASKFTIDKIITISGFRYMLLSVSLNIFGNIRIIPFVAGIVLVILTYCITSQITKKRFAGIVAMVILLQSYIFLRYDTVATYENFWTMFYLFSLYTIYKKWYLSPISFTLSVLSKPLATIFLPLTLFFIYRSDIHKKKKFQIIILYFIVIATILIPSAIYLGHYTYVVLNPESFLAGFAALGNFLRFDGLIIVTLLPLSLGLFIASRRGILHADSMMVLISGTLWSAPLLSGLTDFSNQAYRLVPFVVFFAIGVGILFSGRTSQKV